MIHELVDNHPWVIYTRKAQEVGLHVTDSDAWKEFGGEFTDELRAYAGMVEDVNSEL